MALTPTEAVRLLIGDTPASYFYPILSDAEIEYFLEYYGGNVRRAAQKAAQSIGFTISSLPTREKNGNVELWNEYAKQYLSLLSGISNGDTEYYLYGAVMPYAAGISWADIRANECNPDNVIPKLVTASDTNCCDDLPNNYYCNTDTF